MIRFRLYSVLLLCGLSLTTIESLIAQRTFPSHPTNMGISAATEPSFSDTDISTTKTPFGSTTRRAFQQTWMVSILSTVFQSPARAERSLGTVTESYRRYVPRMEVGFRYLAGDLKDLIQNGKTDDVAAEITADKGTRMSAMKGTMKIFATAFSDSVLSASTRELQLAALKTSDELNDIVAALRASDVDKALESHRRAVYFAQVYAETANGLIPRSLDPIVGPLGVGKRLSDRDTSVTGAF